MNFFISGRWINFWSRQFFSVHVDNKKKNMSIIEKGPTQGLGEHSLTAEKMYSISFTVARKYFV